MPESAAAVAQARIETHLEHIKENVEQLAADQKDHAQEMRDMKEMAYQLHASSQIQLQAIEATNKRVDIFDKSLDAVRERIDVLDEKMDKVEDDFMSFKTKMLTYMGIAGTAAAGVWAIFGSHITTWALRLFGIG